MTPPEEVSPAEDWFPFRPEEDFGPSVIDMREWLDPPAGKHGPVRMRGGRFAFEDGTPVRFWGTNLCWDDPACDRRTAERWPKFMAKYGVNCVRLHKFTYAGGNGLALGGEDSVSMDPEKMDRMDYFVSRLRAQGIYYGWSPIFWHKVVPAEADRLLAYDEVVAWNEAKGFGDAGLVNFAPDLQDIHIELVVGLLEHENPYTGLRYADDPALVFVELQNEDDIFWSATQAAVEHCPTYRALLCRQFCDWLRERYGTPQHLAAAWGEAALGQESLDADDVCPAAGYEQYTPEHLAAHPEKRRRLLDSARFLYETQNRYYGRFSEAIRETGYRAPLVGSCWQAGHGLPHYCNLHSDYLVGYIDRHNYYGGGAGRHSMATGPVRSDSMLARPGSRVLSTGLQQVEGRPFALSEWMCVPPNPWGAEAAPLVAAYGMGLQGWNASYQFCSRTNPDLWWDTLSAQGNVYNVDSPLHLGQYPALARMVYRGDVRQGDPAIVRKIYPPALLAGDLDVTETMEQDGDTKSFGGETPVEALAVGRVLVRFPERPEPHERANLYRYWDREAGMVHANTSQLSWHSGDPGEGFVVIDTPATQGVVGFAGGECFDLSDVRIEMETYFASLLITSLERDKAIAEAGRLLISAVARAMNTGMSYSADHGELLAVGEGPLLLEPVEARIGVRDAEGCTVCALDHAGRHTEAEVPVECEGGTAQFRIGARHGTIYYELRR